MSSYVVKHCPDCSRAQAALLNERTVCTRCMLYADKNVVMIENKVTSDIADVLNIVIENSVARETTEVEKLKLEVATEKEINARLFNEFGRNADLAGRLQETNKKQAVEIAKWKQRAEIEEQKAVASEHAKDDYHETIMKLQAEVAKWKQRAEIEEQRSRVLETAKDEFVDKCMKLKADQDTHSVTIKNQASTIDELRQQLVDEQKRSREAEVENARLSETVNALKINIIILDDRVDKLTHINEHLTKVAEGYRSLSDL